MCTYITRRQLAHTFHIRQGYTHTCNEAALGRGVTCTPDHARLALAHAHVMQKNATRTHATHHGSGWCMRGAAPSRALALHLGGGGGLPRMWAVATRGRLWAWAVETRGRADGDGADRAPLSRAFSPPKVTPATRAALATAAEATVCTADQRHQTAARDHSLGF